MIQAKDLVELLQKHPDWTEIDGDDFEEQELPDGTRFDASIEIRETEPAGWSSRYFAILDAAGDWDDPYEGSSDDEEED